MREIKFRGKSLRTGKWVYGSLVRYGDGRVEIYTPINPRDENSLRAWLEEVDPATVGQCTGLKDKNGTEIYEGDIVSGRDSLQEGFLVTGVVDYENGSFIIKSDLAIHYRWLEVEMYFYELKVIGNSHENPELLEYEKEAQTSAK